MKYQNFNLELSFAWVFVFICLSVLSVWRRPSPVEPDPLSKKEKKRKNVWMPTPTARQPRFSRNDNSPLGITRWWSLLPNKRAGVWISGLINIFDEKPVACGKNAKHPKLSNDCKLMQPRTLKYSPSADVWICFLRKNGRTQRATLPYNCILRLSAIFLSAQSTRRAGWWLTVYW